MQIIFFHCATVLPFERGAGRWQRCSFDDPSQREFASSEWRSSFLDRDICKSPFGLPEALACVLVAGLENAGRLCYSSEASSVNFERPSLAQLCWPVSSRSLGCFSQCASFRPSPGDTRHLPIPFSVSQERGDRVLPGRGRGIRDPMDLRVCSVPQSRIQRRF